jgi:phosphoserine phosphatase RsbU/P
MFRGLHAVTAGGQLEIWVANGGKAIPPEAMERLFQPFFRGEVRPNQQGLGLGLHIASEIATAHGGTLTVDSSDKETRFTFRMPVGDPAGAR